jgi:pyruvate,water dikinase
MPRVTGSPSPAAPKTAAAKPPAKPPAKPAAKTAAVAPGGWPRAELFGATGPRPGAASSSAKVAPHLVGALQLGGVSDPNEIHSVVNRAAFDRLSDQATGAGAAGMPEVKFLIDRKSGEIFFIPKEFPYHYEFATKVLGVNESVEQFNKEAYLAPDRHYIAGTITAYDNYVSPTGKKGQYGVSFWSTDIVRAPMILEAYKAIETGMSSFAKGALFYHPGGDTQEALLEKDAGADRKALQAAKVPVLTNTVLSQNFDFSALNPGVSFGTLRTIHGSGAGEAPPTRREVAIYADEVPATLPPVAGVATPKPQTYLSHDALKARQDHTPYAYARDILKDPKVKALEGKLVRFEVTPKGYDVRAASKAEADGYFEKLRPKVDQQLKPDLSVKKMAKLDAIGFKNARAFGSKSTNVAELHKLQKSGALNVSVKGEPKVVAPDGFGLPAAWYATFMNTAKYDATHTFDQRLTQMTADPKFKVPTERTKMLADFQEHMEKATMPAALQTQINTLQKSFKAKFPGEDMRIRSSSDSEDLQGFNGAGLFDSFTFKFEDAQKPGRSLADRLKKVFASVWNDRAYSEFDFYRIDPHSVDMAELVMPNTPDEIANGVVRWGGAIPGWDTMTVNAQVGDNLVTNPEGGATPDSIVVGNYGFNGEAEVQYEQRTNQPLPAGRKSVLTDGEVKALFKAMKVVQAHFAKLYGHEGDPNFSIECEFKITKKGELLIKQARPWVG